MSRENNSLNEGMPDPRPIDLDTPDSGEAGWDPLGDIKSGLKIMADVGISIGSSVDKNTDTLRAYLKKLEKNTPVNYATVASGVCPASGQLVLNLGTADQGTVWEVQSVAMGGTDYNVVAAGSAGLYVGALPTANGAGMGNLADRASALPNTGFYGTRQLLVNDQEYLFVVINGGTNGQTYVANAQMTVYNVDAAGGKVEVTS